jgi:Subtilase family
VGPFFFLSPPPAFAYTISLMFRTYFLTISLLFSAQAFGATIAIIDTGFDLDHDFLKPKLSQSESQMEAFDGWNFHDNSHLKKAVIEDPSSLQEILLYRNLKAKGHREGLSMEEFDWYKKKSSEKEFMEKAKKFKKHAHGTFVAGIALREGENINIFPIRGLNLPNPVLAVEVSGSESLTPLKGKTPEEKFQSELKNSLDRVNRKFSKICRYLSLKNVEVVNASYGITHKNIISKFRDKYKEIVGGEIDEKRLETMVASYFDELYAKGSKTISRYPKILFVFSAGNSGLNNDLFQHYPSKIKLPNTISVAAMNGEYLASFSNYGVRTVDVGAPGVAILSLVPKVYSQGGTELYSPSSGTSMAAPYISNIAAQILNANPKLVPEEIKRIILETGDEKPQLKALLSSGSAVNNHKAVKAALLSKDMKLNDAIYFSKLNLFPMEDEIKTGLARPQTPQTAKGLKERVLETLPKTILPLEVEEEPTLLEEPTKAESSSPKHPVKEQPDSPKPLPSEVPESPVTPVDPTPSSQTEELSPPPSAVPPTSSSPPQPSLPTDPPPEPSP